MYCGAQQWSPTISVVRQFIDANGHLPKIPSVMEVKEYGIELADFNAKLQQKIEELTLYLIKVNNRIKKLEFNELGG